MLCANGLDSIEYCISSAGYFAFSSSDDNQKASPYVVMIFCVSILFQCDHEHQTTNSKCANSESSTLGMQINPCRLCAARAFL